MSFVEIQFPPQISYGSSGGPEFSTDIVETFGGHEQRNINWSQARGAWNVAHGVKNESQYSALLAFFRARYGRAIGFRFKDWSDYNAIGQIIGTGNGVKTEFQLVKSYISSITVDRPIKKPVSGTVQIFFDGVSQPSGWSVNTATGVVTFLSAPGNGVIVSANFEFDVPARFDTDKFDLTLDTIGIGSWGNIPVVEIRL